MEKTATWKLILLLMAVSQERLMEALVCWQIALRNDREGRTP